jgi:hypothetical protein
LARPEREQPTRFIHELPKNMDPSPENLSESFKLSKIPMGRTILHKQNCIKPWYKYVGRLMTILED